MNIFCHIFLSNYWRQESDIWSQASYRYVILWEAFLDPSDSYFLYGLLSTSYYMYVLFVWKKCTEKLIFLQTYWLIVHFGSKFITIKKVLFFLIFYMKQILTDMQQYTTRDHCYLHFISMSYSIYTSTFCKYMYCVFEIHMICCTVRICTFLWMLFNFTLQKSR
jgi:hypothetical protein